MKYQVLFSVKKKKQKKNNKKYSRLSSAAAMIDVFRLNGNSRTAFIIVIIAIIPTSLPVLSSKPVSYHTCIEIIISSISSVDSY